MAESEIERRLRQAENDITIIKDKVNDFLQKLDNASSRHMSSCNFMVYKDELLGKFEELKRNQDIIKKDFKTQLDEDTGFLDDKVEGSEKSLKEQLKEMKTHFYKVLGTVTTVMMFILGVIFSMQKDKVSTEDYRYAISELSKNLEKQIDNQNKLIGEMTNIKITMGIISSKIDNIEKVKR